MGEDNSPDYLLPSNGGYNPKPKTVFVEETVTKSKVVRKVESPGGQITYVEEAEEAPKVARVKRAKNTNDYVRMLKSNIASMRQIKGDTGDRYCLKNLSKNHL